MADRIELGTFLRSRRDRLTPAQAGIEAFPGPRRVPGLRKEELAVLAGVSPDYYSRLEQGRQANVSRAVLDALARALRLDATEREHLLDLADPTANHKREGHQVDQRPDPGLLRLIGSLDHRPVVLLGRRGEVLAHNALFAAVLRSFDLHESFVRFLLTEPLAKERIVNWDHFAATSVAALRRESGRHPQDAVLSRLIEDLRRDPQVEAWWADHGVRDYGSVAKKISHPVVGDLAFDIEIVGPPHDPDQRLVVYTTEPDSNTAQLLPVLASWSADAAAWS